MNLVSLSPKPFRFTGRRAGTIVRQSGLGEVAFDSLLGSFLIQLDLGTVCWYEAATLLEFNFFWLLLCHAWRVWSNSQVFLFGKWTFSMDEIRTPKQHRCWWKLRGWTSGFETSANFVEEQKPGRPGKQIRERSLFKGRARGVNLTDTVVVGLSVIDASGAFAILCWGVFPKTLRNMWVAVSIINICLPSLAVVWTWEGVFLFTENHSVRLISFCGRTKGETLMFFWVANWWQWLNLGTGQVFFLKWGCASVGWIDWPDTYCVSIDKVVLTFRWCIEVSFRREIRFCAGLSSWASMSPQMWATKET